MREQKISDKEVDFITEQIDDHIKDFPELLPLVLPARLVRLFEDRWDSLNRNLLYQDKAKHLAESIWNWKRKAHKEDSKYETF